MSEKKSAANVANAALENQLTIEIDGKKCTCTKGEYLYDVAKRNGIFIPVLCRNDAFDDHRACCRICVCEVEERGRTKIVTACVYPVNSEIIVRTNTERIKEDRAVVMALLKKRAPESKTVNQMADFMGGSDADGFGRLMNIDGQKCILCGLCVQACDALGTGAISTVNRGTDKCVDTPYSKEAPSCIGCLSCANVCPTGAIEFEDCADAGAGDGAVVRKIWDKEFKMAKCEVCGAVLGTEEQFAYAGKDLAYEEAVLCDACKKQAAADRAREVLEKI